MNQQSMFLDCTGAIASLVSTVLYIRINRYAWLTTIVAAMINGWLYWHKGIYGDALLEMTYLVSAIYGWIKWQDETSTPLRKTRQLSWHQWLLLIGLIGGSYWILCYIFTHYTNSTVAHVDSLTTVLSLAAQWLMSYRFTATWGLWLLADLIYLYMYLNKHLTLHALLMLVYVVMAVIGYLSWKKNDHKCL